MTAETRTLFDRETFRARPTWERGLFMLLFGFVLGFVQFATIALAIVQFVFMLLTGRENEQLRDFGRGLALYARDVVGFLTCASDVRPFPFSSWPQAS